MLNQFKRLFNQIIVYGLGDTINKLAAILLVPLFTRYLVPAEYGVAGILTVANSLLISFCDLGMSSGLMRYFKEEDEDKRHKLINTAQIVLVGLTMAIALICLPFLTQISQLFFRSPDYAYLVGLNLFTIPLTVSVSAVTLSWRMAEKAKLYATINTSRVITGFIINIVLIVFLHRGVKGLFEGPLLNAAIYSIGILFFNLQISKLKFSKEHFKKMFIFGFPFIFSGIFLWIVNWADRFILSRLTNLTEVGLYGLGYSLGMAIMLPVGAFNSAWTAFYTSIAKEDNAKKIYSLILTYYFLIIIFFVLIISIYSRDYFYFFTPEIYHGAYIVVPVIALAYAFNGSFSIAAIASFLAKKTYLDPIIELVAACLNIGLMFVLIPVLGRMGAAWATLAAYVALPIMIIILTYKFYQIKYEYLRILQILAIGFGVYYLTQLIYQPTLVNVLIRTGLLLLYPIVLYITGFFKVDEVKALLAMKNRSQSVEDSGPVISGGS
jgi:O-antigen/teichoic acid export membrane protein